jgi:AcrR family transcriptional regulator
MNQFKFSEGAVAERRETQKREREARILRAAAHLLTRRGFERTTMSDIARRAELAVGTLYNYFGSKPEIVLALVRRDTASALEASEAVLKDPGPDPVAAVQDLLERAGAPFARHDRSLWRQLIGAALADPDLMDAFFAEDLRLVSVIAALLRELRARGDLRADLDVGRAATALYAVFFTWYIAHFTNEAVTHEVFCRELRAGAAVVLRGCLEAPPDGPRRSRTRKGNAGSRRR